MTPRNVPVSALLSSSTLYLPPHPKHTDSISLRTHLIFAPIALRESVCACGSRQEAAPGSWLPLLEIPTRTKSRTASWIAY
jgi:hypothetical protein